MPSVYALGDPRTNEIRYIGIAQDVYKRYAQHLNHPHPNETKNAWMQELKQSGAIPTLTILESDVEEDLIYKREQYWIQHYLNIGEPLTNIVGVEIGQMPQMGSLSYTDDISSAYTVRQMAELLDVCQGTIYRLAKKGLLKSSVRQGRWYFERSLYSDWINWYRDYQAVKIVRGSSNDNDYFFLQHLARNGIVSRRILGVLEYYYKPDIDSYVKQLSRPD